MAQVALLPETTEPDAGGEPSPWLRVARLAALVIVGWGLFVQVFAGAINPPILVVTVVFAALVPLLRPGRRWVGAVAVVLGLAAIGGNWGPLVDELSHPSSALGFTLTLIAASSGVLLMVSGAGIITRWSGQAQTLLRAWAGLVAIGALFAFGMASSISSIPMVDGDVEVVTKANEFRPDEIVVSAGQAAVWIDNRDVVRHTFTVPELAIDAEIVGRKSQRIEIDAAPGQYVVFCTVPGHENMVATLVVE